MAKMFIVARYVQTPRNPKQSHLADFGKNAAAWQNNEEVRCVKNVSSRVLTEASVVLDVAKEKVIKNRFGSDASFQDLYKYYLEHYADYIDKWIRSQQ